MDKRTSLSEAIDENIEDGDSIYIGGFQYDIPCAAIAEIIRQGKKNLKIWTTTNETGIGIDLMVGAGCVDELHVAWLGNWQIRSAGKACTNKKFQEGKLDRYDYSNFSATLACLAAYLGIPFIPIRSDAESDLHTYNPNLRYIEDKETGEEVFVVNAAEFDVAIVHAFRADQEGNAQRWGTRSSADEWAGNAADYAIITCEEIVSTDVIRHDPDRTIIHDYKTRAVVEVPWGAHPSGASHYYIKDVPFEAYIGQHQHDEELLEKFLDEWIYGCEDQEDYIDKYIKKFGYDSLERLKTTEHAYPMSPIDYGSQRYDVFKGIEYGVERD